MESNPQALPARLAPKHESKQLIKATKASETGWKFRLMYARSDLRGAGSATTALLGPTVRCHAHAGGGRPRSKESPLTNRPILLNAQQFPLDLRIVAYTGAPFHGPHQLLARLLNSTHNTICSLLLFLPVNTILLMKPDLLIIPSANRLRHCGEVPAIKLSAFAIVSIMVLFTHSPPVRLLPSASVVGAGCTMTLICLSFTERAHSGA